MKQDRIFIFLFSISNSYIPHFWREAQFRVFTPGERKALGKPHISILSTRNVICSFGGEGGGGGGVAAVTFLCKTSWKNSIVFSKALTFRNHLCRI